VSALLGQLSPAQAEADLAFQTFAELEIAPIVERFESAEMMCPRLLERVAEQGYLGLTLPTAFGGGGADWVTYGLLHRRIGMAWGSLRNILTAHTMVAHVIHRWGRSTLKHSFLPLLASGEVIATLCLSEPNVGSAASCVETSATPVDDGFVLNGEKTWITAGQLAGVFLVIARTSEQVCAFLVDRETAGVSVVPIRKLLGTRASMLSRVIFSNCFVTKDRLVGTLGSGFSHVANAALDLGRYSVACGCAGIAQACVDASQKYATQRLQFGKPLREHQLVQKMLVESAVDAQAAWLMCLRAGVLRDLNDPDAIVQTAMAKYFASRVASNVSAHAVQIHGANGCSSEFPVSRFYCDAKVMEIIEGTTQIMEVLISSMI